MKYPVLLVAAATLAVSACAGGINSATLSTEPAAVAANSDVLVQNTIIRVGDIPDAAAIRAGLEEMRSGLYWTKGAQPAEALLVIDGNADVAIADEESAEAEVIDEGANVISGRVMLVRAGTEEVIAGPVPVRAEVADDHDVFVGLTTGIRDGVKRNYLLDKFMQAAREALYGRGV